jgi:hypothetical protein
MGQANVEYKLHLICHSVGLSVFMVWVTYQGNLRMADLEDISLLWECLDVMYVILTGILLEIAEM